MESERDGRKDGRQADRIKVACTWVRGVNDGTFSTVPMMEDGLSFSCLDVHLLESMATGDQVRILTGQVTNSGYQKSIVRVAADGCERDGLDRHRELREY